MAKSFRQLPGPDRSAGAKSVAEQDFFDLLNAPAVRTTVEPPLISPPASPADERPGNSGTPGNTVSPPTTGTIANTHPATAPTAAAPGNAALNKKTHPDSNGRNIGNTTTAVAKHKKGNPDNSGKPGNSRNLGNTPGPRAVGPEESGGQAKAVRQTFVVSQSHLERLRDHVHARRARGDYNYSQKEALQTALDLLFAQAPPVGERPESVRALEQQRGERVRKGRRATE